MIAGGWWWRALPICHGWRKFIECGYPTRGGAVR